MDKYSEAEKRQHIMNLAASYAGRLYYSDVCGYGSWTVDEKRPFGFSSNVEAIILEICEIEPEGNEEGEDCYSDEQIEYAKSLYQKSLGDFLAKAITGYCQILTLATECSDAKEWFMVADQILEVLEIE